MFSNIGAKFNDAAYSMKWLKAVGEESVIVMELDVCKGLLNIASKTGLATINTLFVAFKVCTHNDGLKFK
jgi:hypothetical protein